MTFQGWAVLTVPLVCCLCCRASRRPRRRTQDSLGNFYDCCLTLQPAVVRSCLFSPQLCSIWCSRGAWTWWSCDAPLLASVPGSPPPTPTTLRACTCAGPRVHPRGAPVQQGGDLGEPGGAEKGGWGSAVWAVRLR